jgi:DNA helicase HerA-like ATPase
VKHPLADNPNFNIDGLITWLEREYANRAGGIVGSTDSGKSHWMAGWLNSLSSDVYARVCTISTDYGNGVHAVNPAWMYFILEMESAFVPHYVTARDAINTLKNTRNATADSDYLTEIILNHADEKRKELEMLEQMAKELGATK